MYDIKWKNDLKMYLNTFNNFIFEGNINDLQPIEDGDSFSYLPLENAIAELYSKDYCVVFFDHTKQSGKQIPETTDENNNQDETSGEGQDDLQSTTVDETWFNSFTFYETEIFSARDGNRIPSPNIELFKEYYTKEYLDKVKVQDTNEMQGKRQIDIRRMYDVINEFEEKQKEEQYSEAKPFMFILPDVSRYMTEPGRPNDKENAVLMILFNITQLEKTNCKLVMFVDKMNDLPPWFESENSNSSLKKLFVPVPDGKIREAFYEHEMKDIMDPIDANELPDKIQKFSAYTENYSLRRLRQLREFIIKENDNRPKDAPSYKKIENIDKTVLRFDLGQSQDPWRDKELKGRIKNISTDITKEIKGQKSSIMRVAESLKSAVTGVNSAKKNDRRPRAIFFFAGPTGTGKTELAKQMAECIFKKQDAMIRFDMSEFREEHSDARLFGAPPGYVGYEAGGELTKAIKQNPFSIILFDEIEKAAPRIWDKFLQILGDGRLTDGKGETVSFTQSIIIFTSNLGITADTVDNDSARRLRDREIKENDTKILKEEENITSSQNELDKKKHIEELYKLYFNKAHLEGLTSDIRNDFLFNECYKELDTTNNDSAFNKFVSECVRKRIDQYFNDIGRREVLGRIGDDNILVFNFISPKIAEEIAKNCIKKFQQYLKDEHESQLDLEISEGAQKFILNEVKKSETLNLGGRGIVTCVEKLLSVPVGDFLFEHEDKHSAKLDYAYSRLIIS